MGRPFLVEYDETPGHQIFVCRQCRTHIALVEESLARNPLPSNPLAIFNEVVNVEVDGEAHYREVGALVEADVYCVNCGSLLGQKIIYIAPERTPTFLREGNFLLQLDKLLRWNGIRMRYADTNRPVEDP